MTEKSATEIADAFGISLHQAKNVLETLNSRGSRRSLLSFRMLTESSRYAEAAKALSDHIDRVGNANVGGAYITCLAFSLELAIKCIAIIDSDAVEIGDLPPEKRKSIHEHKISALFDLISEENRTNLAKIFSAKSGVHCFNPDEFRRTITEKAEDSYVVARYSYETLGDKNFSGKTIWLIIQSAHELISRLKDGQPNFAPDAKRE